MKQFKKIDTITIVNEDMKVETRTKTTLHKIRSWEELSREEQEEEIESRHESIYETYQDTLYENFKCDLDNLKCELKNIEFEDIYFDSCSQGSWIDIIKGFKVYYSIDIFGETLEVADIDLHIRKYIDNINENDINIYDYYIDSEKMEKIENSKKYKNWIKSIIKEVNDFIDKINDLCKGLLSKEYYCPYNLEDQEDKEFFNWYFEDEEFETIETIDNIEV